MDHNLTRFGSGVTKLPRVPGYPAHLSEPSSNELDRAEYLLDRLKRAVDIAEFHRLSRTFLNTEEAKELCQLQADSLKTAKQLKGKD